MLTAYLRWENGLRDLVDLDRIGVGSLVRMVLVAVVALVVMLAVARGLKASGALGRFIGRFLPARVASVTGGLVVALVAYVLVTGAATHRLLESLDATFMTINDEFSTDVPAPTSRFLSGGPALGVTWDGPGRQGRVFIAHAPTSGQIAPFSTRDAKAPIRALVGVGTDRTVDLRQEAALAVGELERLGAFHRAVRNVVTPTGSGGVNENQAQSLYYLWHGDSAPVSMQYPYLPSLLSLLVDGNRAETAARLLFDAVYARWSELPPGSSPELVVSGESLGSLGAEGAFSGAQDLAEPAGGALFVGRTANNSLWRRFTAERDPGTPEVLPTYYEDRALRRQPA